MSRNLNRWSLLVVFSLGLLTACEGGETILTQRTMPSESPLNEMQAGEMLAGEMLAGEMLAGEMLAGEMLAGEMLAGEMLAGEVLEECGINSEIAVQSFLEGPLNVLAGSCTDCHNAESFRRFKLSFDAENSYSPEQVQEGLDAVEPFIVIGDGAGSLLASKMIDDHSELGFDAESPEYTQMVTWIDSLISCD